uniref:Uncharacterized protein n=1 Tax=Lactuca sativa TaxID=4236 RepID=A0A9R1W5W1_LACSA|nr:hypothetical protein LSAT_V11C300122170 [Lactuca sativa]
MIEAERLLLQAALENPANQRFLLLSDSCVPLYNFTYIYNYLMGSSKSFVDSFLDMKEGRYNPRMSSIIPMRKWRKGSQRQIWSKSLNSILKLWVLNMSIALKDDSMKNISEIPVLLEWNHEYQLCWNGIMNSNSVGITEVDA